MRGSRVAGLVLLCLLRAGDLGAGEVSSAADRVIQRHRGDDSLDDLAARKTPEPWHVVDELCRRGEFDAAAAFAEAATGPDLEALVAYVVDRRTDPTPEKDRRTFERARTLLAAGRWEEVVQLLEETPLENPGTIIAVRTAWCVPLALLRHGDPDRRGRSIPLLLSVALRMEKLGWLSRASLVYRQAREQAERVGDESALTDAVEAELALERARGKEDLRAECLAILAGAALQSGDSERAARLVEQAESIDAGQVAPGVRGHLLLHRAALAAGLGDLRGAEDFLLRALAIGRDHKIALLAAFALAELSYHDQLAGRPARALRRAVEAEELLGETMPPSTRAWIRMRLGEALAGAGDPDGGVEQLRLALALARRASSGGGTRRGLAALGRVQLEAGRFQDARRAFVEVLETGGSDDLALLGNLSLCLFRLDEAEQGVEVLERALATATASRDAVARAYLLQHLGLFLKAVGRTEEAQTRLEKSLSDARRFGLAVLEARNLALLGELLLGRNDTAGALRLARRAAAMTRRHSLSLSPESAAILRDRGSFVWRLGIRAAAAGERPEAAFAFMEGLKAGALLQDLAIRESVLDAELSPALRDLDRVARLREAEALSRYRRALASAEDPVAAWEEAEAARSERARVLRRVEREARGRAPDLLGGPRELADVQSCLGPEETLLLYAMLSEEERAVALVVRRSSIRLVDLGGVVAIEQAATALLGSVSRPEERGLRVAPHEQTPFLARRLGRLVLDPLGLEKSTGPLIVSPDGPLTFVPFAALTERPVSYVPSGSVLATLRENGGAKGEGVLSIGNPEASQADLVARGAWRGFDLAPLPESGREAEAVGDTVLLGKEATIPRLLEELGRKERWRSVHFACHGLVDPAEPSLSGLALTPTGDDLGLLECARIYRSRVDSDLVVLSACETARGRLLRAEGVFGWTRAFLFAGARAVIVSAWPVDDRATRALMERFYAEWKEGKLPVATALRRAQRSLASEERWSHPYFWAAWQVWGAPD